MDEDVIKNFVDKEEGTGQQQKIVPATNLPWVKKDEISSGNNLGWQKIPVKDLPSTGIFYPEDTEVLIRAAIGEEIRHWSTLVEDDLSLVDDMINYVIERCCTLKSKTRTMSWRDIKEIDRFYILLAIREYTFVSGENKLQVNISETEKLDVTKEMIDFINFDERLLKYYDSENRCFKLKFKNGRIINIEIPSVGVTSWLKAYIIRKNRGNESFDQDFITYAPFIIREWRGLTDATYQQIVMESQSWGASEFSVLNDIKNIFKETINPIIKYTDKSGAAMSAPLNFQGGIKSLFLISDSFAELE